VAVGRDVKAGEAGVSVHGGSAHGRLRAVREAAAACDDGVGVAAVDPGHGLFGALEGRGGGEGEEEEGEHGGGGVVVREVDVVSSAADM
jgi:hypothetical protein